MLYTVISTKLMTEIGHLILQFHRQEFMLIPPICFATSLSWSEPWEAESYRAFSSSGLPSCQPMKYTDWRLGRCKRRVRVISCSVMSDSLRPHGLQSIRILCPWNFPGKNTRASCHFLLQRRVRLGVYSPTSSLEEIAAPASHSPSHSLTSVGSLRLRAQG